MFCGNCGSRLTPGGRYCVACGSPTTAPGPAAPWAVPAPSPRRGNRAAVVFGVGLLAVIGITIAVAIIAEDDDGGSQRENRELTAGPNGEYPDFVRESFMSECLATGGFTDYCTCVFDEMSEDLTLDEFVSLDQEIRASDNPTAVLDKYITRCLSTI